MVKAYLGLGSNVEPRIGHLQKAVESIGGLPSTFVTKVSDMICTKAQGQWREDQQADDFVNYCIEIETAMAPQRLLDRLKEIERQLGRDNEGMAFSEDGRRVYSNRTVDIDILLYGRRRIHTRTLEIPHPRMEERDFVMIPLKQVKQ